MQVDDGVWTLIILLDNALIKLETFTSEYVATRALYKYVIRKTNNNSWDDTTTTISKYFAYSAERYMLIHSYPIEDID